MIENREYENVYAYDIKNVPKHISEVQSGKHGYYCMGCGKEMIAKKGEILKHHFAHDAKDVKNEGKCYFSDETYRHKIAKEILQRIKQIKVPTLYKFPDNDYLTMKPMKIRDSWFINAHRIEIELQFFEDEDGNIRWGRNLKSDISPNQYLLIRPDVTFFDIDDKPILLIELVATHKIDKEKLIKIKRLGIDTVEVSIPKDHPKVIEETFLKTSRTKWVYSYEQEKTKYIPTANGDSQSIPSIDEFQIQLLKSGESYECKSSEINNLIRGIRKIVDSEQYRNAKQSIIEEIQRIEANTERNREQLRKLQIESEREIIEQLRPETERIRIEARRIDGQIKQLEKEEEDLEGRYIKKDRELREEEGGYRPSCQAEIDEIEIYLGKLGTRASTLDERLEELTDEEIDWEREYQSEKGNIEYNIGRQSEERDGILSKIKQLEETREGLPAKYGEVEAGIRAEFEEKERALEQEFERYRIESLEAIRSRDCERASRVKGDIKAILEGGELTDVISSQAASIERLRIAKKSLDSKSYKNWI